MMRLLTLCAFALIAGCANPQPVPTSSEPDGEGPKADAPSACVQACTDARRVEAIDWSVIVAECEASCAKGE